MDAQAIERLLDELVARGDSRFVGVDARRGARALPDPAQPLGACR